MKNWWLQLQVREQRLVIAMTAFVAVFLFFNLIWQPLNQGIEQAERKLERQQKLLVEVQEKVALVQQAKNGGKQRVSGSLSSIVNRIAKQHQITIARVQPQGDDIQVWIEDIAFSQLLNWLNNLTQSSGLQVKAIDLTQADTTGMVNVRRLQLGRG